jgi:hypothetical protein
MRFDSRGRSLLTLALLLGTVFVSVGCPKHENFSRPLGVEYPPRPENFVITNPQNYDYDFNWSISDPGAVKGYRVYLLGGEFGSDELIGETTQPSFLAQFPFSVANLTFAVRAVSNDNVEGLADTATAP